MASNPFATNSVDAVIAQDRAQYAPTLNPRKAVEEIAAKTGTPANVLFALGEQQKVRTPEALVELATNAGAMIGGRLAQGGVLDDVLDEYTGGREATQTFLTRAQQLEAQMYPERAVQASEDQPGLVGNAVRGVGAGVVSGVGAAVEGLGTLADTALSRGRAQEATAVGRGAEIAGDWFTDRAESLRAGMSDSARQAVADSTPDGDLLDPSTWSLGTNPSLEGYLMLGADVLGSFLPVVAAGVITGGAGAVVVGGSQSAGSGAQTARATVEAAADEIMPDGRSKLEHESAFYREALASGLSPDEAAERTAHAAVQFASTLTAPIGAFGGAATQKILSRGFDAANKGGALRRAMTTGALSAVEEGAQEAAEGIATRLGIERGTGMDMDLTEGTFGDFVLGALGGAVPGAVSGALGGQTAPDAAPETDPERLALPSPTNGGTVFAGGPVTDPRDPTQFERTSGNEPRPSRPLRDAARQAPDLSTGIEGGATVSVTAADMDPIEGKITGETALAVTIQTADGEILEIPRSEVEAGSVTIMPVEAMPASEPATASIQDVDEAEPVAVDAPSPDPLLAPEQDLKHGIEQFQSRLRYIEGQSRTNGWSERLVRARATLHADMRAAGFDPATGTALEPSPAPEVTEQEIEEARETPAPKIETKVNGSPFGDQGAAFRALTNRKLDPNDYDITPQDGGFVAIPRATAAQPEAQPNELAQVDDAGSGDKPAVGVEDDNASAGAGGMAGAERAGAASVYAPADSGAASDLDAATGPADTNVALTVEPIREKAAILKGWTDAEPPKVAGVSLKLDEKAGGYIFSRKHADKVQAALIGQTEAPTAEARGPMPTPPAPEAPPPAPADPAPAQTWQERSAATAPRPPAAGEPSLPAQSFKRSVAGGSLDAFRSSELDPKVKAHAEWLAGLSDEQWSKIAPHMEGGDNPFQNPMTIDTDYSRERLMKHLGEAPALVDKTPDQATTRVAEDARAETARLERVAEAEVLNERVSHAQKNLTVDMTLPARNGNAMDLGKITVGRDQHGKFMYSYSATYSQNGGGGGLYGSYDTSDEALAVAKDTVAAYARSHLANKDSSDLDKADARKTLKWLGISPNAPKTDINESVNAVPSSTTEPALAAEASPIAIAAAEAAAEPTEAQKEAGNYKKGHARWQGMDLSIENAARSERSGVDKGGKPWSVTLPAHYGYIRGTKGADGDHVDFYMGEMPDADHVVIVNQVDADTGAFDEHKVILGHGSTASALTTYRTGFSDGRANDRLGSFTAMTVEGFKNWLANGDLTQPTEPVKAREAKAEAAPMAKDEHPGLVIKSLQTGKTRTIQPAGTKPPATGFQKIGENARGKPLFEDERGVRAYSDSGVRITESVGVVPDGGISISADQRNRDYLTADEWTAKEAANAEQARILSSARAQQEAKAPADAGKPKKVAPDAQPEQDPTPAKRKSLSSLSKKEQDRAALLRARIADRLKNQVNSGIDPAILVDAVELAGLYIKDGYRKFRGLVTQVAEDMDMTPAQAEPWVRAAYNQARDDMELNDQDVSDMDDAKAVLAEVKAIRKEATSPVATPSPEAPAEAIINETAADEAPEPIAEDAQNEPERDDQGIHQDGVAGSRAESGADGSGSADGDDAGQQERGSGLRDQDGAGDYVAGGVESNRAGSAGDAPTERQGQSPGNFVISKDFPLGEGTPGKKIDANIAAIRLTKQLDAENRFATPEEQAVLARFVGWGGLKRVFDPRETGKTGQFGRAQTTLRELLTQDEYGAARRSTADAHYTSREVVTAMWEKMRGFGFDGGRALEPTIGAGNFLGLQPADLSAKTEWHASELDALTGRIAKHLYPDANVFDGKGFQNAPFRPGSMDVAIGNPPFGSDIIKSKLHPELPPMSVHNYIIAKTGLLLRPGGIMGVVVTNRFLDTANPQARDYLARHFNFLGAVRLPNTAFKANAGTEVTTDIVWFQKRAEGEPSGDLSWLETDVQHGDVKVNGYFAAYPHMMLGRPAMDGTMYGGKDEFTLHADGRKMDKALAEALGSIQGSLLERTQALEAAVVADKPTSNMAIGESQLLRDGRVMIRRDDDSAGNPTVEELTADSPWGKNAAEQRDTLAAAERARDAIKGGTPDEQAATGKLFIDAANQADAFRADGGKKSASSANKVDEAIYAIAEGLTAKSPYFGPKQEAALADMRKLVDAKKLGPKKLAAMKGLLGLRNDAQALLKAENADDPKMEDLRTALAKKYRAFVKANGFISSKANDALIGGVPGIEAALEVGYKPADKKRGTKERAKEAAILRQRIITPYKQIMKASTPADGVHISLRERGRLDLGFIASLTGSNIEDVTAALTSGDKPQAYFDPERGEHVIADEYLSGNLAERIEAAQKAGHHKNVAALEAAMPAPKEASQITPSIRSLWIPPEVFTDFLTELGAKKPKVFISRKAGTIAIDAGGRDMSDFGKSFATERKNAFEIFEAVARGKSISVYDLTNDKKLVKNEVQTTNANAAADRMAAEFEKWAYLNPERQAKITDAFNTTMNVVVPRKFDGVSYLTQVGNNPEIKMRNSQKNGAWRMMLSNSTLLHHVVGAGKTFTAITAIMERKRLGLSRKSLVAVPNHLVSQWARDFYALYPGANILAASEKDFAAKNRRKLIARIATGDYDAIIIGHSQLSKVENDPQKAQALIGEQLADLEESLEEAKRSGDNRSTVSQIQKRIDSYKDKLEALHENLEADTLGFTFDQTGIDNVVVDEAQEFKNLEYSTSAERLVGMNAPAGSQRALDLYTKTRTLLDKGQSVGFLTGTPVSNSLVEIYSVMKYLAPSTLREMGLMHYDSWASSFIKSKIRFEYTAAQKLKERNVMAGLVNLGPLSDLYRTFADIVMRPDVERMYREQIEAENAANGTDLPTRFPTPKVKDGGRQLVSIPASADHKEFTDYLVLRMDGIKRNAKDKNYPKLDNALWVLSDARKASIDIRTVLPDAQRSQESKVVVAGDNILRIAKAWEAQKGTQMVFADSSVPSKNANKDVERILKSAWEKAGLKKGAEITARLDRDKAAGKPYAQQWGEVIDMIEDRMSSGELTAQQMDALEEWQNGDEATEGAGAALTADTGFSFYDDLRAYLGENGIPADQVAFIHDYDTAAKKAALFDAVNDGDIRVLIGSTFKMGAGTNAQKRLVALHHIDAPWRPSDMEQREGRIIRQGNDLYEADPDGFEVEIKAYATEQTSDVVLWQVLERKAAGIEQFLNATADTLIEEDESDADSYATFMAQSTGNPIFLQKMETEKAVRDIRAAQSSEQMIVNEAKRFLERLPTRLEHHQGIIDGMKGITFDGYKDAGQSHDAYMTAQAAYDSARTAWKRDEADVRERNEKLPEGAKKEQLPKFDKTAPVMLSGKLDAYSAKVKAAILQAQEQEQSDPIDLGNRAWLTVFSQETTGAEGARKYFATLDAVGDVNVELLPSGAVAKNPLASRTLVFAMMPENIESTRLRIIRLREREIATLNEATPSMEVNAERKIDRSELRRKEREQEMLTGRTRVAEVAASRDRVGKVNRFAINDTKGRDLAFDQSEDAPLEPKDKGLWTFHNAGNTLTAGFGAKGKGRWLNDANGKSYDTYWFEAVADDAESSLMLVQAAQITADPKEGIEAELRVVDVFDTGYKHAIAPTRESRFLPPARASGARQATDEQLAVIEDAARAALAKMGIEVQVEATNAGRDGVAGQYRSGVVSIMRDGLGNWRETLDHEAIHALRDKALWGGEYGLFTQDEWRALVKAARADKDLIARVADAYGDLSGIAQTEEAVAQLYAEHAAGRRERPAGALAEAFGKVRSFFRSLASALRGEGFVDAAAIMDRIANGQIGGRGPNGGGGKRPDARLMPMESRIERDPVASLTGNELGDWASMSELRGKAYEWYRANLIGQTVTNAQNGWQVGFNPTGSKKTTKDNVGDRILRMVPAIPQIIERGEVFLTEHDDRDRSAIRAVHKIAATVMLAGERQDVVLTIRETHEGTFHYALNEQSRKDAGAKFMRTSGRIEDRPDGMEDNPGSFNLAFDEREVKESRFIDKARAALTPVQGERNLIGRALTDAMGGDLNVLALVPGRALYAELGKALPSAQKYLRLKEEMDATRNEWHGRMDEVSQKWRKAMSGNGDANKTMMAMMHEATIAGVDPARPFERLVSEADARALKSGALSKENKARILDLQEQDRTRIVKHREMSERWEALPAPLKAVWSDVRNAYEEQGKAFEDAVLDNVRDAMTIGLERAEKRYEADMREITDEGLTGQEKAEAEDAAKKRLNGAKRRNGWGQQARISSLRNEFETNKVTAPYFPLMRFGRYFVTTRDEAGKVISFSKFEREADQLAEARAMKASHPNASIDTGVINDSFEARSQVDPTFVADVEALMGEVGADRSVMDGIWQKYIETLPDLSVRRSKLHRKGTDGYNADAFRAFGRQMFHGSHQLARLQYAIKMQKALEDAEGEAAKTKDANRNGQIVTEMTKRHAFVMNPTGSAIAQRMTSAAFVYYLGVTPAAALVNLSQTTVVGIPMLAAGFKKGGATRAAREMMRALKDFTGGVSKEGLKEGNYGLERSKNLTADESAAVTEAYRRGTIDKSQAHDLAGVGETGVAYSDFRQRWMGRIGYAFHHTERLNREVTYLAAYRMARDNGFSHMDSIDKAADLTWKTHFDYSNTSRPRLVQGDWMKVLLTFRNFQINMIYRLFRDVHQSLNGATEAERSEARTQLLGITASMMLHAGVKGTWGYAILMMMASMFLGMDDDELEEEIQKALVGTIGTDLTGILLKGAPGHLTGLDLTNRMGMPELWFRSNDRIMEGEDSYNYYLQELVGAVPAMGESAFRAASMAMDGNWWRGVETAMPKFGRDLMRGWRYFNEGATTMNGDLLMDGASFRDAFKQAMGFTPARIAERYEANSRLKNAEKRIEDARKDILRDVTRRLRSGKQMTEAMERRIAEFNGEYPERRITGATISRSLKGRIAASDQTEGGIRLNRALDRQLRQDAAPALY